MKFVNIITRIIQRIKDALWGLFAAAMFVGSTRELEAYYEKSVTRQQWSPDDFLRYCKKGLVIARKYPDTRDVVAGCIAEVGHDFAREYKYGKIIDLATDLEQPDDYHGNSLKVQQKWLVLEKLVNNALRKS